MQALVLQVEHKHTTDHLDMPAPDLLTFYESHLFDDVLPFWLPLVDREHGGLINAVRNDGTIVSHDKLLWSQGRALWVYATLYSDLGRDPKWLEIADVIAVPIMGHRRSHEGLWPFSLARDGSVKEPIGSKNSSRHR
jgi:N-acylglucosamine 2-epimerase